MYKYAKVSWYKIEKILRCFCIDIIALKTAALLGMNRNTINFWYGTFRKAIYAHQMKEAEAAGVWNLQTKWQGVHRDRAELQESHACAYHERKS